MNKLIFIGNLGRDPEMRYTPNGESVASFSAAVTRRFKSADGQAKELTTWYSVSVWGKQAEACHQYLRKGSKVAVEGELTPDENGHPKVWKGNDGIAHASYDVRAQRVEFLSPKDKDSGSPDEVAEEPSEAE
jgi:single-strand DNA-binding protein